VTVSFIGGGNWSTRRKPPTTTVCDKVCQWLATGRWFSPGTPISSTNKTDRHGITEILLKVVINTKKLHKVICNSYLFTFFFLYHYTTNNQTVIQVWNFMPIDLTLFTCMLNQYEPHRWWCIG
jgi:hypothetical protein